MGSAGVDAKNFQRIEALFNAALERSADEREAFVRASDEEPAIRDAALRLLARAFEDDATLQAAALAAAAVALPRAKRIGPYEVLGELGTGGMGTVLLAERAPRLPDRVCTRAAGARTQPAGRPEPSEHRRLARRGRNR
jgi:serine/threonine-protein kinase